MAVWQFSMHLVPRSELLRVCTDLVTVVPGPVFDEVEWWSATQPPLDLAERLSRVLPEVAHWHPGSRQWGASDTNSVSVGYSDGRVDSIWARVDLRGPNASFVDVLCELAMDSDGWWVGGDADRRVPIGQGRARVAAAVAASDAAKFVADPRGFIEALGKHSNDPS